MTKAIARVHPVHLLAANPQTKPTDLGCESAPVNGCHHPHPPSPFVIVTQPESRYSFHHPTEGGRLSRPCVIILWLRVCGSTCSRVEMALARVSACSPREASFTVRPPSFLRRFRPFNFGAEEQKTHIIVNVNVNRHPHDACRRRSHRCSWRPHPPHTWYTLPTPGTVFVTCNT